MINFLKLRSSLVSGALCALLAGSASAQTDSTMDLSFLDLDLEQLLELQVTGRGEMGSFGSRLSHGDGKFFINGYITNEFFYYQEDGKPSTFDNHYFNTFVGTKLGDKFYAEIQFEYEHGGEEIQARYAQVDYKVSDKLIIRSGKFLIPINGFNEFIYPEYINKSISRPYHNRNITPTAWAEVGVQARGTFELKDASSIFYSAYVVNGLEGDEGGDIRSMRNNHRDKNNNNKALGGRIGYQGGGLEVGAGIYNGAYTEDGSKNLMIAAFDGAYKTEKLSARAEFNLANMEAGDSTIARNGANVELAYRVMDKIEPVARYDFMNWGDADETLDKSRIYLGVNYYLMNTVNIKLGYEIVTNKGTDVDDNILGIQFAAGF